MKTKFIILTQHRSGATNLMTILNKNKGLTCVAEELKYHKKANREGYGIEEEVNFINGFYEFGEDEDIKGFRVFPSHFLNEKEMKGLKEQKDVKVIFLTRKNILQHIYSIFVAFKRKRFHIRPGGEKWYKKKEKINIGKNYVNRKIRKIRKTNGDIKSFLKTNGCEFLEVEYETLFETETLDCIYEYLGYNGERNYKGDYIKTNSKESVECLLENKDEINAKFGNEENGYL